MTTLLIILLAVALAVALYFITYLRRALVDSEDDNERLRRENSELTIVSHVVYAAARRQGEVAAALAVENERHLVSLEMVLTEVER